VISDQVAYRSVGAEKRRRHRLALTPKQVKQHNSRNPGDGKNREAKESEKEDFECKKHASSLPSRSMDSC
jgi:hypothetical protein